MTAPLRPVAVTCGDPAGIGPETAAAAWRALGQKLPFFLIGDPGHLPPGTPAVRISAAGEAIDASGNGLPILAHPFPRPSVPGRPDPANARSVIDVIELGVALVNKGSASAIVTLPISKGELASHAGFAFPGHTEFLAHLAGGAEVAMMLAGPDLRVVPATIHIPLSKVPHRLTEERLEQAIRLTHGALIRDFGIARPRIAVAGLNPHAGEGGLLGTEEVRWITPLLDRLRGEGLALDGPLPADTMFHARARRGFDAAVAMYHDQALIPIKTLAFDEGVNVTLGLPFVRTSPDHGTAFGIAGRGEAHPGSTIAAIRLAAELARRRRQA